MRPAGLLAPGSSLGHAFPLNGSSGWVFITQRPLSPVTAAGPRRIFTVFPLVPLLGTGHGSFILLGEGIVKRGVR